MDISVTLWFLLAIVAALSLALLGFAIHRNITMRKPGTKIRITGWYRDTGSGELAWCERGETVPPTDHKGQLYVLETRSIRRPT